MIRTIFPNFYQIETSKLRQQLEEAHAVWWKEHKLQQPDFTLKNIRFMHDPAWNKRFFSIQSAHDGSHIIWKATRIAWIGMGGAI